jgi:LysM repeat protein
MKGLPKSIIRIILALALLGGIAAAFTQPAVAAPEQAVNCKQWHTVKSGDYLSSIARQYGVNWRDIAEINNLSSPYVIRPGQKLCVSVSGAPVTPVPTPLPVTTSVRVYATKVVEDKEVTLAGKSLAANTSYIIYLSKYKGTVIERIKIGKVTTDKNGSFSGKVFKIPSKLADIAKIRVELFSGKKAVAENWFINANVEGNTGGYGAPVLALGFVSAKPGKSVKVQISNIPANVVYLVYIGKPGDSLDKMVLVDNVQSPKGKNIKVDFAIPAKYSKVSSLEIRIFNKPLDMSAYLVFANK